MVDDEYLPVPIPVAAPALADAPESSMLVEFGGKRLSGELRRSHGWPLRYSLTDRQRRAALSADVVPRPAQRRRETDRARRDVDGSAIARRSHDRRSTARRFIGRPSDRASGQREGAARTRGSAAGLVAVARRARRRRRYRAAGVRVFVRASAYRLVRGSAARRRGCRTAGAVPNRRRRNAGVRAGRRTRRDRGVRHARRFQRGLFAAAARRPIARETTSFACSTKGCSAESIARRR